MVRHNICHTLIGFPVDDLSGQLVQTATRFPLPPIYFPPYFTYRSLVNIYSHPSDTGKPKQTNMRNPPEDTKNKL